MCFICSQSIPWRRKNISSKLILFWFSLVKRSTKPSLANYCLQHRWLKCTWQQYSEQNPFLQITSQHQNMHESHQLWGSILTAGADVIYSHEIFTPNTHIQSVNCWSGLITQLISPSPCAKQPKVNICSRQFGKHREGEDDWEERWGGNGDINWQSESESQSLYLLCTVDERNICVGDNDAGINEQ